MSSEPPDPDVQIPSEFWAGDAEVGLLGRVPEAGSSLYHLFPPWQTLQAKESLSAPSCAGLGEGDVGKVKLFFLRFSKQLLSDLGFWGSLPLVWTVELS